MWDKAGIVRTGRGLDLARMALSAWQHSLPPAVDRAGYERHNLVLTGRLVVEAALMRQESRGAHYRSDFPEPSTGGLRHFVFKKAPHDAE
jgi:L-aspartate oxidase